MLPYFSKNTVLLVLFISFFPLCFFFLFLLFLSFYMFFSRISNLLLSDNLSDIGAKESPAALADASNDIQTIAFIPLRLGPPIKIRTIKDACDIVLNHDFLRLLLIFAWLIICGLIETFLAQLSDMRYEAGPAISKVRKSR